MSSLPELEDLAGRELGPSRWRSITQEQVNLFADVTDDHQWVHVDVERAAASPLGGTIAHGYLTLALLPAMLRELIQAEGAGLRVNYGLNRVRFPAPVPVGSRVRARALVKEVATVPGGSAVVLQVTVEVEGRQKPACVAETVTRFYTSWIDGGAAT